MINKFDTLFVTFFGLGKIKFAPGTFASFITTLIIFCYFQVANYSHELIILIFTFIFFYSLVGINNYIKYSKNKDPKEVVIDEVIGQFIPLYLYEISHGLDKSGNEAIFNYFYIFLLFRFFDIKKPFPINYFDKNLKNSFGVVFDDIIAGLYVVLTLIIFMIIKTKLAMYFF